MLNVIGGITTTFFAIGLLCFTFLSGARAVYPILSSADSVKTKCEKELPRNQECQVFVYAKPKEVN